MKIMVNPIILCVNKVSTEFTQILDILVIVHVRLY